MDRWKAEMGRFREEKRREEERRSKKEKVSEERRSRCGKRWESRETLCFSPHLCVGFLFLILYPASSSAAASTAASTSGPPSLSHSHFVTHHLWHTFLSHTTLSPTIFDTHYLSHTTLSPTMFHTQLCHTPSCHTPSLSHTTLSHTPSFTTLSPTIFHTQLCHTQLCHPPSFTHNFVTHHLSHTTLSHTTLSYGRRGTWWHPPSFRVAGVALGNIHLCFAWQACHLVTSTFVSHGRPGAWSHPPSFCVGRSHTTLSHTIFHTHLCHTSSFTPSFTHNFVTHHFVTHHLRHNHTWHRGTWWHAPSFHVACLALGDIYLRFTWQAWHLETSSLAWQAWHLETSTCVWRGRHSTCCTWWRAWSPLVARGAAPLWVAGVALGDIYLHLAWQAWRLFVIYLRLAWQAWHLLHLVAHLVAVGRLGRRATLRGRRGTWWHSPSFAWQAWHLETSTCVWLGRRGTCCTWWRARSPLLARGAALQHLVLIIGRSCLVALSGPLIPMILWLRKDQR